jgi:hypothetical protein
MEKNLMRSMELVSRERREVARQLSIWGEECDEDVSDVTDKLGVLVFEIGELEDQFIDRYDQYRVTIKSIRNIEASVQPSRDRKSLLMQRKSLETNTIDRKTKDHRPDRPAQVQGPEFTKNLGFGAGACAS